MPPATSRYHRNAVTIQGAGAGISVVDGEQPTGASTCSAPRRLDQGRISRADHPKRRREGRWRRHPPRRCRPGRSRHVIAGEPGLQTGGGISSTGNVKIVRSTVAQNVSGGRGGGLKRGGRRRAHRRGHTVRRDIAGRTRRPRCQHGNADQQHHQRQPRQCEWRRHLFRNADSHQLHHQWQLRRPLRRRHQRGWHGNTDQQHRPRQLRRK